MCILLINNLLNKLFINNNNKLYLNILIPYSKSVPTGIEPAFPTDCVGALAN